MRFKTTTRQISITTACAMVMSAMVATPAGAAGAADHGPRRHGSGLLIMDKDDVHKAVPDALRDALGAYDLLAEADPEDFGYAHVSEGAIVVDVTSDRGASRVTSMRLGKSLAPASADPFGKAVKAASDWQRGNRGTAVKARRVATSRAQAERVKHEISERSRKDAALASAGIWQTEVDRSTGHVVVTMERLTDGAAARLVGLYGTEQVAVVEEPNPESADTVGRLADGNSFYGGARIKVPAGSCTDAFAWNIASGVSGMLTAGHCIPDGGSVSTPVEYIGGVASGSRENYSSTGTAYLPGQSVYRGDMALIQVTSGKSSTGRIYRGAYNGTSSNPVRSMWSRRSQPGDQYCTGGSYGGEICGWTVSAAGVDRLVSGKWKRNIVVSRNKQGWCTRSGDSGGAVYTVNSDGSVVAKGIHNSGGGGGSDDFGGAADPCDEQFTDIWDAFYGFPGNLRTQ